MSKIISKSLFPVHLERGTDKVVTLVDIQGHQYEIRTKENQLLSDDDFTALLLDGRGFWDIAREYLLVVIKK
jgi:hypothetical protein